MSSRENEDAFVISKVMKGGPKVLGWWGNLRGGGDEGEVFNWGVKGKRKMKKREGEEVAF